MIQSKPFLNDFYIFFCLHCFLTFKNALKKIRKYFGAFTTSKNQEVGSHVGSQVGRYHFILNNHKIFESHLLSSHKQTKSCDSRNHLNGLAAHMHFIQQVECAKMKLECAKNNETMVTFTKRRFLVHMNSISTLHELKTRFLVYFNYFTLLFASKKSSRVLVFEVICAKMLFCVHT